MRPIWCGLACGLIVLGLIELRQSPATAQVTPDRIVWLVRHAEKAKDGTTNPPLNEEGKKRADKLAGMLADKNIVLIITSDQQRTRQTAKPLVDRLTAEKKKFEKLEKSTAGVIAEIRKATRNALVVHHSNTVPSIINELRGKTATKLPAIKEGIYNRIFILEVKGTVFTCMETTYEEFGANKEKPC